MKKKRKDDEGDEELGWLFASFHSFCNLYEVLYIAYQTIIMFNYM